MATALHDKAFRSVVPFSGLSSRHVYWGRPAAFLEQKSKNQQDTAKEHAPKSLELTGNTFAVI
jgi:hypothetical protein